MKISKPWLSADWPAPDSIQAGTTLRRGGVSINAYASLNPAQHVGDDLQHVKQNRDEITVFLDLPSEPVWLTQTHGIHAIDVGSDPNRNADAAFTTERDNVCCVMTADCLPLLICSRDGSFVAAVHAGWRGLLAGVIENTLKQSPKTDILVWLGPAIGQECFEVGDEVRTAYLQKSQAYVPAFSAHKQGKWLADIYQLARITLLMHGVENIYGGGLCTVCDAENFYSYRRDGMTGRMASLIWIT